MNAEKFSAMDNARDTSSNDDSDGKAKENYCSDNGECFEEENEQDLPARVESSSAEDSHLEIKNNSTEEPDNSSDQKSDESYEDNTDDNSDEENDQNSEEYDQTSEEYDQISEEKNDQTLVKENDHTSEEENDLTSEDENDQNSEKENNQTSEEENDQNLDDENDQNSEEENHPKLEENDQNSEVDDDNSDDGNDQNSEDDDYSDDGNDQNSEEDDDNSDDGNDQNSEDDDYSDDGNNQNSEEDDDNADEGNYQNSEEDDDNSDDGSDQNSEDEDLLEHYGENSDEDNDDIAIQIIVEDTFDKGQSEEFLRGVFERLMKSGKDISGRVRHIARIHGLPQSVAKQLVDNLRNLGVNLHTKLDLAQALKYSCRHDKYFVAGDDILNLLSNKHYSNNETNDEESVSLLTEFRSELVFALCSLDSVSSEFSKKICCIQNISAKAKSEIGRFSGMSDNLLKKDLGSKDSGKSNDIYYHDEISNSNAVIGRQGGLKFQKPSVTSSSQCHAVKAQQISTEKCHESSSEKEQLLSLSLTNALNSRNKSIAQEKKESPKNVQLPDETSSTSHQSWFSTTYGEVEKMKNLASTTAISAVDQQYLYNKLGGWHATFSYRTTINEMVAETFYRISSRQKIKLEHFAGLLDILSNSDSQYTKNCKTSIVEMVQRCVSRNSSFFTQQCQNKLANYMKDCKNVEVEQTIFDIFTDQSDGDSKFVALFAVAFDRLTHGTNKERKLKAIRYISLQSLNSNRVNQLFDSKVMSKLISLINNPVDDMEIRKQVGEILENYLEHGNTPALGFDCLIGIANTAKSQGDNQFKQCLVRIILKNVLEKYTSDRIPKNILEALVKITLTADATLFSIILVGLKYLSSKVAIPNVEILAPKLLDISKISESDLKFNSQSNSNEVACDSGSEDDGKVFVSSIVAEILLESKKIYWTGKSNNFMDSTKSFDYILQAIEISKDKQTRILASEFLYHSSMVGEIPELYLNKLIHFKNDSISDIRIYSLCVYSRGMLLISKNNPGIPIGLSTMDTLARTYAYEKIVFDTKEYSIEINDNILKTFECEAEKENSVFTVNVFNLLGHLFSSETKQENISQLVNILKRFCTSHNKLQRSSKIPDNVMHGLENVLFNSPENTKQVEKVFEKIVLRGQIVSEKILRRYFDRFFVSSLPKRDCLRTLKLIFAANRNQDLSESLFSILRLELISLAIMKIQRGHLSRMINVDVDKLWELLSKNILQGNKLTFTNFEFLKSSLKNEPGELSRVLNCLTLASQNGQSIPDVILELVGKNDKQFWADSNTSVKFCLSLMENNQSLPSEILRSIATRFENGKKKKVDFLLPLVILPAKLGTKLRKRTVQKLCHLFGKDINNEEILLTLVASAKNVTSKTTKKHLCQSFLKSIFKNVPKFIPTVLDGLQKLVQNEKDLLTDNDINGLVELLHRLKEPESLCILKSIVRTFDLTPEQKKLMTFCNVLDIVDDSEYLMELSQFIKANKIVKIPRSCFQRFQLILNGGERKNVESAVSTILNNFSVMKCNFPDQLSRIIGNILVVKKDDDNLAQKCKEILCRLAVEIKFSQNLISILEANFEASRDILYIIMDMNYKFNNQTKLIFNLAKLGTVKNDEEQNALMNNISDQLKCGLKITPECFTIILNLETQSKHFYEIVFMLVVSGDMNVDETVAKIISKSILDTDIMLLSSFQALNLILKSNIKLHLENFESYQKSLIFKLKFAKTFETQMAILTCLVSILKKTDCVFKDTLKIFVNNLQSAEPSVRGLSFKALRHYRNNGHLCQEFDEFASRIIDSIKLEVSLSGLFLTDKLSNFEGDLLETLISIDTGDLKIMLHTEKQFWIRELLKSNFVAKVTSNPLEKRKLLTKLEEIFKIYSEEHIQCKILKFLTKATVFCNSSVKLLSMMGSICLLDSITFQNCMEKAEINEHLVVELQTLATVRLLSKKSELGREVNYNLAKYVVKSVGFDFGYDILKNLKSLDNLQTFRDILDLSNKFVVRQLNMEKELSLDELRRKIEHKILIMTLRKRKLIYSLPEDNERLQNLVIAILNNGLNFDLIFRILTAKIEIKNDKNISIFEIVLELILQYNLNESVSSEIKDTIRANKVQDWIEKVVQLIVKHQKSKSGLKCVPEVIKDLSSSLEGNADLQNLIRVSELDDRIRSIQSGSVQSMFSNFERYRKIEYWGTKQIQKWAHLVKNKFANLELQINYEFSLEALCVTKRAFYLCTNFHLTNVQIIAILVGLNKGLKGQLQQVATGSGKSTIIAILAVINALHCNGVDIYTSSPVLAERDAKNWAIFYSMFGLSCSHNGDKGNYVKGLKSCYNSDIVYGETSMFQFDYLRDKYSNLGTMGSRNFYFAIVDEVDSMLVDDLSKLARLSSLVPGMDLLQILYHVTWHRLINIEKKLFTVGNSTYFMEGKIGYDENSVAYLEVADATGEIKKVDNLLAYIQVGIDLDKAGITVVENLDTFVSDHLKQFLTALTTEEKIDGFHILEENRIKIPKNLQYFVQNQIPKWVENAMTAMGYQENVHYVIDEEQIKPVDYNTTGIVQDSTAWSGGLHQFLQLKHGLKMTSETMPTNFMSNLSLFQKYQFKFNVKNIEFKKKPFHFKNRFIYKDQFKFKDHFHFTEYNIIGFTGTMGSKHTRKVLSDLYNVNCVKMPLTHHNIYIQYPDELAFHKLDWIQKITQSLRSEATKGRGVLVICETIKDAHQISQAVKNRCPGIPVKLYTQNNSNQEQQIERIQPGEVFIATNLAGRGTDIKTDDIEKFGGLHVILTFLANNVRVEEQAFGRTSRQGHLGSGQLICVSKKGFSGAQLRKIRDETQKAQLELFLENELPLVRTKDKCFEGFCNFLRKVRENLGRLAQDNDSVSSWTWNYCKSVVGMDRTPTAFELITLQAVEERWAMFLTQLDDRRIPLEQAWGYYKFFERKVRLDCRKNTVILSPFYHIAIGNDFFMQHTKYNNYNSDAKKHYDSAIKIDPEFATAAYVNLGNLLLRGSLTNNQHEPNYRINAIKYFEKAMPLVQAEISNIVTAQALFQDAGGAVGSELCKQLTMKQTALTSYSNFIQNSIDVAKRSIRPIDIIANSKSLTCQQGVPYGNKNPAFTFSDDPKTSCKNNFHKLSNSESFDLVFNNLTKSNDSGVNDQAIKTISKCKIEKVEIQCKSVSFDNLLNIFLSDQYVDHLPRDSAIACINNWQSQASYIKIFSKSINIDVDLVTEDGVKKLISDKNSEDSITSLKNLKETDFVNLIYNSGNEATSKIFKKVKTNLNIYDLNFENIQIALQYLSSSSINLCVRSRNAKFIENIKKMSWGNLELRLFEVGTDGTWKSEKCLLSNVNANTLCLTATEVEFLNLDSENVCNIIEHCKDCIFDLKFVNLYKSDIGMSAFRNLKSFLRNCQVNFPSPSEYSKIIPVLRNENLSFSVVVYDLSKKSVDDVLNEADLSQEVIQQSKQTILNELFPLEWMPVTEIVEFQLRGVLIMCEFNENSPIPWFSIGSVAVLVGVQFAIGGVLIVTGFGATVGMGLITEGAADLFTAYRAYANRQFSWEDYAKQKAISLATSAGSMGWGKLKDAGKGLKVAVVGARKKIGNKVGSAMLKSSGRNLKSLVFKQIRVSVGEAAAREGLNALVDMGSQLVIDKFKPQVLQTVEKRVIENFSKPKLKKLIAHFWALDKISNSQQLNRKIQTIVGDITNPKTTSIASQWNSVGLPLCQGILSSTQHVGGPISVGLRVCGVLNGLKELYFVIDNVCSDIVKKLESQNMTVMCILVTHFHMTIEDAQKKEQFVELEQNNDDIYKYSVKKNVDQDISNFFMKLNKLQKNFKMENVNMTIETVSGTLSEHIINVADTQMRAPATTFLVGKGVANLSHYVQANFVVSPNHDTEDVKAAKGNVTVADQINANANDYTISYHQVDTSCKIAEMSNESRSNGKPRDQVIQKANEIAKDAPADLSTMSAMGKMFDIEIKFVDEKYKPTAEDSKVKLVVYKEGVKDDNGITKIGHFKLMDSKGNCVEIESDKKNCGFAVIKHLTGSDKTIENIREETAKFIVNNAKGFDEIISNEKWISDYHPTEANKHFLVGGQREITEEQEKSSITKQNTKKQRKAKKEKQSKTKQKTQIKGVVVVTGASDVQCERAIKNPDNENNLTVVKEKKVSRRKRGLESYKDKKSVKSESPDKHNIKKQELKTNEKEENFQKGLNNTDDKTNEMESVNTTGKSWFDNFKKQCIAKAYEQTPKLAASCLVGKAEAVITDFFGANCTGSSKQDATDVKAANGIVTIADQINASAKYDTTSSYQQVDTSKKIARMCNESRNNGKPSDQVIQKANEIAKDAPADLATMSAMGKMFDIDIKFVDENYIPTTEDSKLNLVVYKEGAKDDIDTIRVRHFKVMDSEGKCVDIKSDDNNCGYAVIKHLAGSDKTIEDIRKETANFFIKNSYDKIIGNENWIEDNSIETSKHLLEERNSNKKKRVPRDKRGLESYKDQKSVKSESPDKHNIKKQELKTNEKEENFQKGLNKADDKTNIMESVNMSKMLKNCMETCIAAAVEKTPKVVGEKVAEIAVDGIIAFAKPICKVPNF